MQTADNAYEGPGKLLIDYTEEDWEAARATATVEPGKLIELPLAVIIEDPANERADINEDLEGLVESIRERGVIEPVLVFPHLAPDVPEGKYMLKSGHRRTEAARQAGLQTIPAIVVLDPFSNEDQAVDRLVANLQRKDLSAMEKARGFRAVLDANPGLTQAELARKLGISQPVVANTMRLLGLPEEVQAYIEEGKLTPAHGAALLSIKSDEIDWQGKKRRTAEQALIDKAKHAADNALSVAALERDIRWYEQESNRNRIAEENRRKQETEQKRLAEERAAKIAAGELPAQPTREDIEAERRKQAHAEGKARMNRVRLAHATMRDVTRIDPKDGPSVEHLRLAAIFLAGVLQGGENHQMWGLPKHSEAMEAIQKCNHKPALIEWIAKLALGSLAISFDGRGLEKWGPIGKHADQAWNLDKEITDALKGAGLLDENGKEVAA